jgi:hypothetical protein
VLNECAIFYFNTFTDQHLYAKLHLWYVINDISEDFMKGKRNLNVFSKIWNHQFIVLKIF